MNRKSLMMLGLLAAAPMASQAAMVEMDDAALSEVQGQAFTFGWALNPALGAASATAPPLTASVTPWAWPPRRPTPR